SWTATTLPIISCPRSPIRSFRCTCSVCSTPTGAPAASTASCALKREQPLCPPEGGRRASTDVRYASAHRPLGREGGNALSDPCNGSDCSPSAAVGFPQDRLPVARRATASEWTSAG